ncbi:MAG TPA: hypothetical protein VIJ93_02920, partial [bacterium]
MFPAFFFQFISVHFIFLSILIFLPGNNFLPLVRLRFFLLTGGVGASAGVGTLSRAGTTGNGITEAVIPTAGRLPKRVVQTAPKPTNQA